MKIFLRKELVEIPGYKETFKPTQEGEVEMKILQKIWVCDEARALEIIHNHPDFYVESTSDNRRKANTEEGGQTDKQPASK